MNGNASLAVDIGGTFTDVVLECDRGRFTRKVLTTPDEPEAGFMEGTEAVIQAAGIGVGDISLVVHGTTLFTNALIERKGRPVAFITTEGHRDVLEIGTESRFHLYDLFIDKPRPLVPRAMRHPVRERLDATGEVILALHDDDVRAIADRLEAAGVNSVAIGFLHSYANPAHERRAAELLRERLPGLDISLSSDISPEMREFDRFSTACANAYIKPVASRYLGRLADRLKDRGISAPLFMMHSGGGMITLDTAREQPIRLLESGPAGGAIFATAVARELGISDALCFDMGGTTAKVCLIGPRGPNTARQFELDRVYRFLKGSGLPVRIPVIEMVEIGAGGGSLASVDRMGRLRVGPESASAVPGPACYARGGRRPTVTDADLALGRIDPGAFGDGAVQLSAALAIDALDRDIATPLAVSTDKAAQGVCALVDEHMANAASAHLQESAHESARRTVIAFGGAGPLHAGALAIRLGADRIVVPESAGVGSAIGFLRANLAFEIVRSLPMRLSSFRAADVRALIGSLAAETSAVVCRAARKESISIHAACFMRYVGQGHEIEVPVPAQLSLDDLSADSLRAWFGDVYSQRYGQLLGRLEIEVLGWRVSAIAPGPAVPHSIASVTKDQGNPLSGAIHRREALRTGDTLRGPAVIADPETTIYVPAGFHASVVPGGHLVMTRVPIEEIDK